MIKEIKYSGYTTVPSDYESPDGDLATAIGLIPEDGALKPILPPSVVTELPSDWQPLYIHAIPSTNRRNIILGNFTHDSGFVLGYAVLGDSDTMSDIAPFFQGIAPADPSSLSFAVLGNMLILSSRTSAFPLNYFQWSSDDYNNLGSAIPQPALRFRLERTIASYPAIGDSAYYSGMNLYDYSDDLTSVHVYDKEKTKAYSNSLLGAANALVAQETKKGRFTQPFLVRYALRLFDGTYTNVSPPVLMTPASSFNPYVDGREYQDEKRLQFHMKAVSCALICKIDDSIPSEWRDFISSIDIFVSAPIYTYDQSKDIEFFIRKTSSQESLSVSSSNEPNLIGGEGILRGDRGVRAINGSGDHLQTVEGEYYAFPYREAKDIASDIRDTSLFYLVQSIPADELVNYRSEFYVDIPEGLLTSLLARPVLDTEPSPDTLLSAGMWVYNQRLHLYGLEKMLFSGVPVSSALSGGALSYASVSAFIHIKNPYGNDFVLESPSAQLSAETPPYYFFFPNPSAFRAILRYTDSVSGKVTYFNLPLKAHDFLNGAVYCNPYESPVELSATVATPLCIPSESPRRPYPSTVYVSEVNNPLSFPASAALNVGQGSVLALSSAAKALSQGQFGQFPLYAFTTEGVWALETSTSGTYIARQPITRDVCINPDGITQIDSAVLFPTDRGIMLISGSQTQCISDVITDEVPFDARTLPGMKELHAMIGHEEDSCFPVIPFLDFIASCGMVYDYLHQRILVFNKNYSYAYVYSLKSKCWGMTFSKIAKAINSYPEALAVDRDSNLISFSQLSTDNPQLKTANPQLLLTRPIKLGEADILKTVDTLYQRGAFRSGHVKSVLYGSRDLFNWHLVSSSLSHRIVNRRGTPYKYFRIALVCELDTDETLCGCTVQYTPRFTNRIR